MSDRATDIQQIINATLIYARGLDLFDPQEALSAYTEDAYWDATAVGLKRFEGAEEILGFFEADAGSMAEQFHIMTNHIVEFDGPGRRARHELRVLRGVHEERRVDQGDRAEPRRVPPRRRHLEDLRPRDLAADHAADGGLRGMSPPSSATSRS